MAATDDHPFSSSISIDSPNISPRDARDDKPKHSNFGTHVPPFFLNLDRKEYAQIGQASQSHASPFTGRSVASSHYELSEMRRLHEKSSYMDVRKDGFELTPRELWSEDHRYKDKEDKEEGNFTFVEKTDKDDKDQEKNNTQKKDSESKKVAHKEKKKGIKFQKQTVNEEQRGGSHDNEDHHIEENEDPSRKKSKKRIARALEALHLQHIKPGYQDNKHQESNNVEIEIPQPEAGDTKSQKKPKKEKSEKKKKKSSSESKKKKSKEVNLHKMIIRKRISSNDYHENGDSHELHIRNDTFGSDGISSGSPESGASSLKAVKLKTDEGKDSFELDSTGIPRNPKSHKTQKKENSKPVKKIKKKEKLYHAVENPQDSERKTKPKKHHSTKHKHKPKNRQALLTDGLNLVKLVTYRKYCKKTKLLVIIFTLTVLWSIILNSLELAFFSDTSCRVYTELGTDYFCFALMILLKLLCISLFNLEITFEQPYHPPLTFLYPLITYFFCPLLQLPQNVYDFNECLDSNKVIHVKDSWVCLHIVIGCIGGAIMYIGIKQKIDISTIKSRVRKFLNKLIKWIVILAWLGWNILLIVVFCGQKEVFLPSFFFDFYLCVALGISVIIFYLMRKKLGEDKLQEIFVKVEKNAETKPLNENKPQEIDINAK